MRRHFSDTVAEEQTVAWAAQNPEEAQALLEGEPVTMATAPVKVKQLLRDDPVKVGAIVGAVAGSLAGGSLGCFSGDIYTAYKKENSRAMKLGAAIGGSGGAVLGSGLGAATGAIIKRYSYNFANNDTVAEEQTAVWAKQNPEEAQALLEGEPVTMDTAPVKVKQLLRDNPVKVGAIVGAIVGSLVGGSLLGGFWGECARESFTEDDWKKRFLNIGGASLLGYGYGGVAGAGLGAVAGTAAGAIINKVSHNFNKPCYREGDIIMRRYFSDTVAEEQTAAWAEQNPEEAQALLEGEPVTMATAPVKVKQLLRDDPVKVGAIVGAVVGSLVGGSLGTLTGGKFGIDAAVDAGYDWDESESLLAIGRGAAIGGSGGAVSGAGLGAAAGAATGAIIKRHSHNFANETESVVDDVVAVADLNLAAEDAAEVGDINSAQQMGLQADRLMNNGRMDDREFASFLQTVPEKDRALWIERRRLYDEIFDSLNHDATPSKRRLFWQGVKTLFRQNAGSAAAAAGITTAGMALGGLVAHYPLDGDEDLIGLGVGIGGGLAAIPAIIVSCLIRHSIVKREGILYHYLPKRAYEAMLKVAKIEKKLGLDYNYNARMTNRPDWNMMLPGGIR